MNEKNALRLLEAVHGIDDQLVREAMQPVMHRSRVYAIGAVAAAAVIAVGAAAAQHAKQPTGAMRSDSVQSQTDSAETQAPVTTLTDEASAVIPAETTKTGTPESTGAPMQTTVPTEQTPERTTVSAQTVQTTEAATVTTATTAQKGGVSVGSGQWTLFEKTVDPDSDSYSSEEAFHVDLRTAEGFYRQMAEENYAEQGIPAEISSDLFGAYLGKITETDDTGTYHGNAAESQEPSVAGADVYYFAGKNRGFLIVQKGDQCSVFFADTVSTEAGLKRGLAFYGVQSAADLSGIRIEQRQPAGGLMRTVSDKTVTDRAQLEQLYALLCALTPEDYSALPAHIGTPQWLVDAWSAYRANPVPRNDYDITFLLHDGTALRALTFQPYLGNGYVTGMQELTPQQCAALVALLQ